MVIGDGTREKIDTLLVAGRRSTARNFCVSWPRDAD
jgi:hypothetical protein